MKKIIELSAIVGIIAFVIIIIDHFPKNNVNLKAIYYSTDYILPPEYIVINPNASVKDTNIYKSFIENEKLINNYLTTIIIENIGMMDAENVTINTPFNDAYARIITPDKKEIEGTFNSIIKIGTIRPKVKYIIYVWHMMPIELLSFKNKPVVIYKNGYANIVHVRAPDDSIFDDVIINYWVVVGFIIIVGLVLILFLTSEKAIYYYHCMFYNFKNSFIKSRTLPQSSNVGKRPGRQIK